MEDDDIEVIDFVDNNVEKEEKITFPCKNCSSVFPSKGSRDIHLAITHYKNELQPYTKEYFKEQWKCSEHPETYNLIKTGREALLHVAFVHKALKKVQKNTLNVSIKDETDSSFDMDDEIQELCAMCDDFGNLINVDGDMICPKCINR